MAAAVEARSLLRSLLRAARGWPDLNMRSYATRRIREDFRRHAGAPAADVPALLAHGHEQLVVVTRQAAIGRLYDGARELNVLEVRRAGGDAAAAAEGVRRPETTHQ